MKNIIGNKYADFYLNAALKLNLSYKIINKKAILVKIYNEKKDLYLTSNILSVNSQVSRDLTTNKIKTSILLQSKNIPSPKFESFIDKKEAEIYAKNLVSQNKEFVIKPNNSSLAYGVTINPKTEQQVIFAISEAFRHGEEVMIEDYIKGENYRVTIFQDELIAVTLRKSAYVTGNGKDTIKILIDKKNTKRKLQKLPQIILRQKDKNYLENKKVSLNSIPKINQNIKLQLGCDLDIGGERKQISLNSIPKINIKMFKKAAKTLMLNFAGIDFIIEDITKPYTQVISAINEINSAPQLDVHYLDQFPPSNYAAERILEKYFFDEPIITDKVIPLQRQFISIDNPKVI